MNVGRNRRARKYQSRVHAAIAALLLVIAGSSASAQAVTGGASTAVASSAQTGQGLAFSPMRIAGATWYGPGFYGHRTACGQILTPGIVGVAHRTLPCGTAIKLYYRGHFVVARVI